MIGRATSVVSPFYSILLEVHISFYFFIVLISEFSSLIGWWDMIDVYCSVAISIGSESSPSMWLNPDWIRRYRKYETTPGWGGGIRFVVDGINEVWPLCMEKLARKDKEINRRHLTTCQIQTAFTGLIRLLSVNTGCPNYTKHKYGCSKYIEYCQNNTGCPNILKIVNTIQGVRNKLKVVQTIQGVPNTLKFDNKIQGVPNTLKFDKKIQGVPNIHKMVNILVN